MDGMEKLTPKDVKTIYINQATSAIIQAYLQYASSVVSASLQKQGYGKDVFTQLDDDLIIKPYELLELIDMVQKSLSEVE